MRYESINTDYGLERLVEAQANGIKINLTHMAVGDGGGNPVFPEPGQTHLVRERYRAVVNRVYRDPDDPTKHTAEMVIPAGVGGFTLREIGVFDDAGALMVVGNLAEAYKPTADEGQFGDALVRVDFVTMNANIITLQLDPHVITASQAWVLATVNAAHVTPGGTTSQVWTKRSNLPGDAGWEDPTDVKVRVTTIEEPQVLAANQTQVDLSYATTDGLAVFIGGQRVSCIPGVDGWQPDAQLETRLFLGKSYPAGTKFLAVQNEPAGELGTPLLAARNFSDVPDTQKARENLDVYSRAEADRLTPVGQVAYFYRTTAPAGWLKANGAAISREAFAALFGVIGTRAGEGDGFNTFNLPDLRGEFVRCLDDGRGIDPNRPLGGGQASQNLAHDHTGSTSSNGSHSHTYIDGRPMHPPGDPGLQNGNTFKGIWENTDTRTTSPAGSHSHTLTTDKSGGNEARPRNVALLACIKY